MQIKQKAAFAVRVLLVPPILFGALFGILYAVRGDLFHSTWEMLAGVGFLGVFPILAYPVWFAVPRWRAAGRPLQRKLAFLFTLIGYTGGLLFGFFAGCSAEVRAVFLTYFCAVLLLTVQNRVFRVRASGHACSVAALCVLLPYFCGWWWIFPTVLLFGLSVWGSLVTKRHTVRELCCGALTCAVSVAVAAFFLFFVF